MKTLLLKFGILNENETVSITNCIVLIFVLILAFKMLFTGVVINTKVFDWTIAAPDIANTLPLLFSLMNYGHKRMVLTTNNVKEDPKV